MAANSKALREQRAKIAVEIRKQADAADGRDFTAEENEAWAKVNADYDALTRQIERVESIEKNLQIKIRELGADRGFDSANIQKWLVEENTYNGICPRDPHQLKERMGSWKFVKLQRRRSQTEGRISIIIHNFLGCPIRSKGFAHRQLAVGWGVLTHNLWVLARLPKRQAKKKAAPLRKAA